MARTGFDSRFLPGLQKDGAAMAVIRGLILFGMGAFAALGLGAVGLDGLRELTDRRSPIHGWRAPPRRGARTAP
ncbi:MAG: hypothetical protein Q8S73_20180 [Deltaproteobacteria bacterium]|nr:hypothetical protein [Myxococcales bacterium]MDP3216437.1 hypothetical protein [Deltaproteobacteria bacterium]